MNIEKIESIERTKDGWWITIGDDSSPFARWEISVCRTRDGEQFVPAAHFDDEARVVLAALHDGVPLIVRWGHAYLPLSWAWREYPDNVWIRVFEREKAPVRKWDVPVINT
jgi:hypothetical protein